MFCKTHPNGLNVPDGHESFLTQLINLYPENKWNYKSLSKNKYITWEIVLENTDKPWDYSKNLLLNPNITFEIIQNNQDLFRFSYYESEHYKNQFYNSDYENPYYIYSSNPNLTWDIVLDNPDFKWNYYALSGNKNITWDIYDNNNTHKWNCYILVNNPNIDWNIMQNKYKKFYYFMHNVSSNPNITWKIIKDNPDVLGNRWKWNYHFLICNPNITFEIIQNYLKKYILDGSSISLNPNLTWDNIINNPDIKWDFNVILNTIELPLEIYLITEKIRNIYQNNS